MAQEMDIGMGEMTSPATLKAGLAELIATALFVFIGVGSIVATIESKGPIEIIALAHGLAIALLAAGIGPISGGHINPAVTFAMFLTGKISLGKGIIYVIAQLIGGVVGMGLLRLFLKDAIVKSVPAIGGHGLNPDVVTKLGGLGVEAFLTFVLVWTVFATAVNPRGAAAIAPLAIGFAVLVIHLVAVPITGAGVNPARTFGPALVMNRWTDIWIYIVGPLIGGGLAGLVYQNVYLREQEASVSTTAAT